MRSPCTKAQGSDFDTVFLVLPEKATTLSREPLYTGLTRLQKGLVLLIQTDTAILERIATPRVAHSPAEFQPSSTSTSDPRT